MQDGDLSIGDLARRTGLTVTAIRFYADHGIIPTSGRSSAGHRRFGADAVARLVIVRALRGLGVDLPTIRRVLAREVSMAAAAADRLPVLDRQIRSLQQQRAALSLLAQQHVRDEGVDAVQHDSVPNTDDADRLMDDFFDRVLRNIDAGPEWVGIVRSMTPVLPADPAAEQALAWVELVEMLQDNDFRELIRVIAESFAAERAATRGRAAPAGRGDQDPGPGPSGAGGRRRTDLARRPGGDRCARRRVRVRRGPPGRRRSATRPDAPPCHRERSPQGRLLPPTVGGQRLAAAERPGSRARLDRQGVARPDSGLSRHESARLTDRISSLDATRAQAPAWSRCR